MSSKNENKNEIYCHKLMTSLPLFVDVHSLFLMNKLKKKNWNEIKYNFSYSFQNLNMVNPESCFKKKKKQYSDKDNNYS